MRGVRPDPNALSEQILDFSNRNPVHLTFPPIAVVPIEPVELHFIGLDIRLYIHLQDR
jgi:hypothetical protein